MLLAILSGFILAILLPLLKNILRGGLFILLSALPLSLFVYFLSWLPEVKAGGDLLFSYQWVPSANVNLSFQLDGLAMLFCLLITGIGSLVFIYTSSYLKGHPYLGRFYGYLSMFMASMLGLVLSDNLLLIFIFWELTSISSFFLIGFNNDSEASRKSALLALSITGIGGLFLLVGFVLLNQAGGHYSFTALLNSSPDLASHPMYGWILFFLFIGAFTKSAQFPFHFWLPGAMKAPTPVSTYLHSATMVKAGIYLLARFTPVLGETVWWNGTLTLVGGVTMLYAVIHALFRIDLKGILAYSTISALGLIVFLLGIGTPESLLAATVFILVHALYKATLFLVTGIIDHETGTRDVTRLAGLNKVMLPVGIAAFMAALSNAGIPPTFGFLGKDLIYDATLRSGSLFVLLTGAAVVTNICLLFTGFKAGISPFVGPLPQEFKQVHLPSPLMWIPPLLLASCGIVFGLFPFLIEGSLLVPAVSSLLSTAPDFHLQLWHGFNIILLLSTITIGSGIFLFYYLQSSESKLAWVSRFEPFSPKSVLVGMAKGFALFSAAWTNLWQNGKLRHYVFTIMAFLTVLLAVRFLQGIRLNLNLQSLSDLAFYDVAVLLIMATSILFAVFTKSRLQALASVGVMGFCICLIFLFYSAPDLAMTQFSIDTLTVILFVLVLQKLPGYIKEESKAIMWRDGILAFCFGTLICILALEVLQEPLHREISKYYAENAYTMAKGKNVVNVILVDFRGFDTMVEITVLAIAALGVSGLLRLSTRKPENK
ncbi:putative monovalent cation/H+ antiporter subunit A [Rufibacter roseus]|uniref:Monovalent cation/H+ antiporter subunit A n=1 Tax=Rufibacter roseus TaxID=1567108 RepID=A0ABW2DRJ5_9BACT|nr:putative monovalent cation/H+ antiporter subunit A [Rufibacter roseus]